MTNSPVPTSDNNLTETSELPKTKKAWIRRLLIIGIPLLLITILSIGGAIYYIGFDKLVKILKPSEPTKQPEDFIPEALNVVDLNIITAELYSTNRESRLLSITISLDIESKLEAVEMEKRIPSIEDAIVLLIRGLRPEDFIGNAGLERVRNEITRRVVDVVKPIRIRTLYIKNLTFTR